MKGIKKYFQSVTRPDQPSASMDASSSGSPGPASVQESAEQSEASRHVKAPSEVTELVVSNSRRTFQGSWKIKYSWLTYDGKIGRTFCTVCTQAVQMKMPLPTSSREKDSYAAFVKEGFCNWKKALQRYQSHESSELHRAALKTTQAVVNCSPVTTQLAVQNRAEMIRSREALRKILTSVQYLAVQGIPIRGKDDELSNLQQLLRLRATDSPVLQGWLERPEKYKWLSPDIINEMLEDLAHVTLRRLGAEVKTADFFAIMLDETSDVSTKEQVSVCVRFVDEKLKIHEVFLGFYETSSTTSEVLVNLLLDVLTRFNFPVKKCRGQCYDGAANMSGHLNGLQQKILEREKRALFVHCRAHNLNLVAQGAIENNDEMYRVMQQVQKFISFVRGSPKRLHCFKGFQKEDGTSFRPFCPTRWILRKTSIISLTSNYAAIMEWLRDFRKHSENRKQFPEAEGFLEWFFNFDVFFKLEILRIVFTTVEDANVCLQGMQLSFQRAANVIQTLKEVIKNARDPARFDRLWEAAIISANQLGLDEPNLPRKRKLPARLAGFSSSDSYYPSSPKDHYRQLYYATIDCVIGNLSSRFEPEVTTTHLKKVEEFVTGKSTIDYIKEFYYDDFDDYGRLTLHRDILLDAGKSKNVTLLDLEDVVAFLSKDDSAGLVSLIPELVKLVRIVLTIPVSTCTAERSFSSLRRIKTYLRSTMTQERLNHVALISCHADVVRDLNLDEVLDNFIRRAPVRVNTFALQMC